MSLKSRKAGAKRSTNGKEIQKGGMNTIKKERHKALFSHKHHHTTYYTHVT